MAASVHAGDVTSKTKIVSKNTETLLDSSKEVGMDVNTRYIFMSLYQSVGHSQKQTCNKLQKMTFGNPDMGFISLCFMSLVDYHKVILLFDDFVHRFLLVADWKAVGVNAKM